MLVCFVLSLTPAGAFGGSAGFIRDLGFRGLWILVWGFWDFGVWGMFWGFGFQVLLGAAPSGK